MAYKIFFKKVLTKKLSCAILDISSLLAFFILQLSAKYETRCNICVQKLPWLVPTASSVIMKLKKKEKLILIEWNLKSIVSFVTSILCIEKLGKDLGR